MCLQDLQTILRIGTAVADNFDDTDLGYSGSTLSAGFTIHIEDSTLT